MCVRLFVLDIYYLRSRIQYILQIFKKIINNKPFERYYASKKKKNKNVVKILVFTINFFLLFQINCIQNHDKFILN